MTWKISADANIDLLTYKFNRWHRLFVSLLICYSRLKWKNIDGRKVTVCSYVTAAERQEEGWTRTLWTEASASCVDSAEDTQAVVWSYIYCIYHIYCKMF